MKLPPWQVEIWNRLVARAAAGAFPHALLLAGAAGSGKRAFAERLAAFLLCSDRAAAPCGRCRSCELFTLRSQRDPEEVRPDGTLAQPFGHPGHPDAKFIGYTLNEKSKKMYTEIVVEQIRDVSAWLALTSQLNGAQTVLIEPADALNVAAANALLKTLEEPGAARYVILVTAHPARLPATIRSRCQRVDFPAPTRASASAWLTENGIDAERAAAALDAANGNPGLALAWAKSDRMVLRAEVARDLSALGAGRVRAADIANAWSRAEPETRLWFAAGLVQQESRALASGRVGPLALTGAVDLTKLSAWFDEANRARELLRGPLRAELVVVELLLAWQSKGFSRSSSAA